jgi:hypothetical protein
LQNNVDPLRGQPRRIIVVDTETVPSPGKRLSEQVHKLRLGVAVFGHWDGKVFSSSEWYRFTRADEFWSWVVDHLSWQRKLTLYAHNAHFDLTILDWWNQLLSGKFRMESDSGLGEPDPARATRKRTKWRGVCVLEKHPYFLQAFNRMGRIDIVDTLNYYKSSLAAIGESIGMPKLQIPEYDASAGEWFDYCTRDTEITLQAMLNLLREWHSNNFGPFGYTLPSLAYKAWRHTFCDIAPVPHDNREVRELERSAYFGGRAAAWFIGDIVPIDYSADEHTKSETNDKYAKIQGQAFILDVRSMYPSVMLRKDYPIKFLHYVDSPTLAQTIDLIQDYCLVANVTIRSNVPEYPYRSNESVIYPVGMYNTSLCTPELHYALDTESIASVNRLAVYSCGKPFDSYIIYWFQRRQQALHRGDGVQAELCKLMLNSLYGRFGMRLSKWITYSDKMGKVPWGEWYQMNAQTQEWVRWRSIAYYAQRLQERGEHPQSCPAVAAHVTSYGRMKMRQLRQLCNPRDILYQDTDSLFVLAPALRRLKLAGVLDCGGLGELRVTHSVSNLSIRGVKNYAADGREVIAGINTNNPKYGPRCFLAPEFEGPGVLLAKGLSATISVDQIVKRVTDSHFQDSVGRDGYTLPPLLL